MNSPITREEFRQRQKECYKINIKPIMEEIKQLSDKLYNNDKKITEKLNEFEKKMIKTIAEMPEKLEEKYDKRYADKDTELEVDKINSNISKLVWLVLGAVVIGVLNLIIK